MFGLVFPALLFSISDKERGTQPQETEDTTQQTQLTVAVSPELVISVLLEDGSIEKMDMDTYLTAVVLQEMPTEFETEALKAQAVVARTYALRRLRTGGKHTGAAVCTSSSCCQGFCNEEAFLLHGGDQTSLEKVKQAVAETSDQVLVYKGELIDATYFSCSGGMTEDAAAVWGADIPYLQSTQSPGEESAAHYTDTVRFSADEFMESLGQALPDTPENWIETITYTDGGGVDTMVICGKTYAGTELRRLLGLRSTAFVITAIGDTVTITTKGFGHRVGMSQYGADAMAVQGSSYQEILAHYYQGTELVSYAG